MWLLVVVLGFSSAVAGYLHLRVDTARAEAQVPDTKPVVNADATQPHLVTNSADTSVNTAVTPSPSSDVVARWLEDSESGNPNVRSTAILALATAPKATAIPALRRVLEGGEPIIDRPLALQSLRDLALNQGDDDGTIRGVVRETIYHADDDQLVERAQLALEIIEESEME